MPWLPAVKLPACDLVMARSALASMVVGSLEVLLAVLLSQVGELTVAVLVTSVPSGVLDGVSTTTLMVGAVAPLARVVARRSRCR